MKFFVTPFVLLAILAQVAVAQEPPQTTEQHKWLHKEEGEWTGVMKMSPQPGAPEMEMPLVETNQILPGGLWLTSKFDCGPFQGHGVFGYDTKAQEYVGIWVDNMTTHMSQMRGKVNEKGELVLLSTGRDPEGNEYPMKSVSQFTEDGGRVFAMYGRMAGQKDWSRMFQITYEKKEK